MNALYLVLNGRFPGKLETLFRHLGLNVANTRRYDHRMGFKNNKICGLYQLVDTVPHMLLDCVKDANQRSDLCRSLSTASRTPFDVVILLGV